MFVPQCVCYILISTCMIFLLLDVPGGENVTGIDKIPFTGNSALCIEISNIPEKIELIVCL